jgi:hypothetical protein
MVKKQLYEAPEAELLTVRFEENFMGTTDPIKPWEPDPEEID